LKSIVDFAVISVINLPERKDRRDEIAQQLSLVGLYFDSPQVNIFSAIRPPYADGFDSIGTRGCFMSHLQVLRNAMLSDNVLILEDDLDFVPDADRLIRSALQALPANWGIFYGGCNVDLLADSGLIQRVPPSASLRNSHFVAFNGHVIASLVAYLEAILQRPPGHIDGGPMHVDGAYSRFRADHPELLVFAAIPELGYQRPSRTDIHALKWFDRVPVVKELVQFIRRRRATKKRETHPT
jgi:GR25 family glycosyltransferase involved in LPS biosynthesis